MRIRHLGGRGRGRDGAARRRSYLLGLAVIAAVAALTATGYLLFRSGGGGGKPVNRAPYGWPLKPFDRPHPIRGNFADPRMPNHHINGPGPFSFHAGVDISAPGGTKVYAVAPGSVYIPDVKEAYLRGRPVALGVRGDGVRFEYWHIRPLVASGSSVAAHQLIGRVITKWGHVHLTEMWGDRAVNPLRVGALTPYRDRTKPTIVSVRIYRDGKYLSPATALSGKVDLVVDAYDTPQLKSNWPWARVTPALICWRLLQGATGKVVIPTQTPVDFRLDRPDTALEKVFAPGTRQNGSKRPGIYNFWLVKGLDSSLLPNGSYDLVVLASDTRGNTARRTVQLLVEN